MIFYSLVLRSFLWNYDSLFETLPLFWGSPKKKTFRFRSTDLLFALISFCDLVLSGLTITLSDSMILYVRHFHHCRVLMLPDPSLILIYMIPFYETLPLLLGSHTWQKKKRIEGPKRKNLPYCLNFLIICAFLLFRFNSVWMIYYLSS